jgi:uncharacterized membrane protein
MPTTLTLSATLALIGLTAGGYAVATAGMKMITSGPSPASVSFVILGLIAAVFAEIILLRHASLPVIYVTIMAFETLLVLLFASSIGERPSFQQLSGAGLVLMGMVMITR